MISQSGGVGMSVLNLMANEGVGLNKFVSVGNMLNITATDVLEYLIDHEETKAIVVYLVSYYGWEELGNKVRINSFRNEPSIKSSLKFLRRTPWAREKVEKLYIETIRQ